MVVDRPEGDGPPVGPAGIPEPEARTTMHARIASSITLAAACTTAALATDTPCEERVASGCVLSSIYPYNTITRLFVEDPDDGTISGYGTGFLVGPHCALTNGHCVYKREAGHFFVKDIHLMPGACRGSWGQYTNEFGSREALDKRTNNKWADTSYTPRQAVDYGALTFVCPFEEISTFMPLCFDYEPEWSYMAGYPTDETPDANLNRNQWLAFGGIIELDDRWVRYEARSTGGASGSPVWNWAWDTEGLAEVFAINSTHWNQCDGGGPRLVWQNENLIREWMRWEPTLAQRSEAGCPGWEIVPWFDLVEFFQAHPERMLEIEADFLGDPRVVAPPTGPSRRKMQFIEHGFYEWAEYDLRPGDPRSPRMIQLLEAPGVQVPGTPWMPGMDYEPETLGFLSPEKARILLSGSASRASKPVTGIERLEIEAFDLEVVRVAPDEVEGDRPDPVGDLAIIDTDDRPCPGDLNGDGKVDGADMGLMLGAWGASDPAADLDGDGDVDGADLGLLLGAWGACA